ncbi:Lipoma-preferred partner-like protein, partial [Anas platyrhynchos]
MSHPSWLPPKSTNEPVGHVTARMETTHAFGTPSISVSTQQTPKKFAPVVAPKPKYNPYKQPGGDGDFLPPPPPPVDDLGNITSQGAFPPPPPMDDVTFNVQVNPGGKTLEERRSSLDAEIDSLTSILADLESSSPYKPRTQQVSGALREGGTKTLGDEMNWFVQGHQRRISPWSPCWTARRQSRTAPSLLSGQWHRCFQPTKASQGTSLPRPSREVLAVQKSPGAPSSPPHEGQFPLHSCGRGSVAGFVPGLLPAHARLTSSPGRAGHGGGTALSPAQQCQQEHGEAAHAGREQQNGSEAPYMPQSTWKVEPAYPASNTVGQAPPGLYQPPGTKKTYITDPGMAPQPLQQKSGYPSSGPASSTPAFRPEDELEHLTKKMLYDMENPPSDDYFGRCARCGENVVGEGTGCTAMDQVFHVECFTCMMCNNKLRGQPFYAVEKKAYCEPCYINTLEQCSVCAKPIMERILRATGKAYHPHCFTCVMCHRSLDGIPFTVDAGGNIHCIEDFHKKFAPRCSVCKEPIMPAPGQEETVRIVALDRDFHVQCYRCEDCGGLLSEGDNQGCYPLDGHILCKTCNSARIQALTAKASTDL